MYDNSTQSIANQSQSQEYDTGLRKFMIGVFNNMTISLMIGAVIALFIGSNPAIFALFFDGPQRWLFILAPLGLALLISFGINSINSTNALILFYLFSALMGISLSTVFVVFQLGSIITAFLSASILFLTMSLWGYTTNRDLTKLGNIMLVGVIAVVIASLVNLFLASSALAFAISVIAVIVFTALTAYDVQNLKNLYWELEGENREKAGIIGALSLYINFINIFTSLLQLFGNREE
jgi:uncharacterized protein